MSDHGSTSSQHFVKDRLGNRKFIGGAAMQRRNALQKSRSKHATRILRPDQVLKSKETLSIKLSPFERYFAGLLRSEASDYIQRTKDKEVWEAICQRLALPVPTSPLPACYPSAKAHFSNRAALVMEESRYAIADGLRRLERRYRENNHGKPGSNRNLHNNHQGNQQPTLGDPFPETAESQRDQSMVSMELILRAVEHQEKTGHSILTFAKEGTPLTRLEKQSLRNGTVFACLNRKLATTVNNTMLAAVMPQSREDMEKTNSFAVMVFKQVKKTVDEKWHLTSITSLLSEQRKYDACMEQIQRPVPFLLALLGGKRPTHLRFDQEELEEEEPRRVSVDPQRVGDEPVKKITISSDTASSSTSDSSSDDDESTSDSSTSSSSSSVEVIEILDSDCEVEVLETVGQVVTRPTDAPLSSKVDALRDGGSDSEVEVLENAIVNSTTKASEDNSTIDTEMVEDSTSNETKEELDTPNLSSAVKVLENPTASNMGEMLEASDSSSEVELLENIASDSEVKRLDDANLKSEISGVDNVVSNSGDEVLDSSDSELLEDVESDDEVEVLETVDVESTFHLPLLNDSQKAAAKSFLDSKPREITLIQGPPGTGKTTLLTSVIAQYVLETNHLQNGRRQLMVCAPTNKAVGVVCTRFLETFINEDSFPCNVILIGDDDKLFDDDFQRGGSKGSFSKLRSVFLYTFIDTMKDDYQYILKVIARKETLNSSMKFKIRKIAWRLRNRILRNIADSEAVVLSSKISRQIDEFCVSNDVSSGLEDALCLICEIMDKWNRESIWQEVLHNADVIFGTLASTGAAFIRKSIGQVEDLIVDEAAAATEPEMFIPFVYSPKRLLAVGDPKQLPATISSQLAERLGLDKSLHERLMYECNFDHVMLDTQYRSKPSIMRFPAFQFYDDKLLNGGNVIRPGYTNGLTMMDAPPYTMFQVNGLEKQARSGSYQNFEEAAAVVEIIERFRPSALKKFGEKWCTSDRLRVITFYQAQVALISQLLRKKGLGNVLVATVDSSQGCEADHVIVSFVRSDGQAGRNSVGFLTDERRLNVGLTRAKFQLICVGNIKRMAMLPEGKANTVRRLATDAITRNCVLPFDSEQEQQLQPDHAVSRKRANMFDTRNNRKNHKRRNCPSKNLFSTR